MTILEFVMMLVGANLQTCEARPDLSGALFVSLGEALAQKSGNGGRIQAPK